jgi:hypothetical protein
VGEVFLDISGVEIKVDIGGMPFKCGLIGMLLSGI